MAWRHNSLHFIRIGREGHSLFQFFAPRAIRIFEFLDLHSLENFERRRHNQLLSPVQLLESRGTHDLGGTGDLLI